MISKLREPINGLTHFIGIGIAVSGLLVLLLRAANTLTVYHVVSFSIFGGSMILLYTFSTLYHWLPLSGNKLLLFRQLDHMMIFIFIAASYTPICLVTIRGHWGWSIFGTVWGLTVAGILMKVFWLNAPRILYTLIYLILGWIIIIGIWPVAENMAKQGVFWMAAGGLFYSIGAGVYAIKKPNPWPEVFGFHEIFHIFIILGSLSHLWMAYHYI